jgi:hypothetical protein
MNPSLKAIRPGWGGAGHKMVCQSISQINVHISILQKAKEKVNEQFRKLKL